MKGKFKPGDRVIVNGKSEGIKIEHQRGKVIYSNNSASERILIEFDKSFSYALHSGNLKGKMNHCWWIDLYDENVEIRLEREHETIVIYRDGDNAIACNTFTDKKAVARCNPENTFDFETGARIAFERLFEKEAFLNTKIVFGNGDWCFKPGRVYEIIEGKIINPEGPSKEYPIGDVRFRSIDDVKEYFTGKDDEKRSDFSHWSYKTFKFIEIKED
jgi:hypothetical protein